MNAPTRHPSTINQNVSFYDPTQPICGLTAVPVDVTSIHASLPSSRAGMSSCFLFLYHGTVEDEPSLVSGLIKQTATKALNICAL